MALSKDHSRSRNRKDRRIIKNSIRESDGENYVRPRKGYSDKRYPSGSPLRKWLNRQTGRPWNHVYSDLCNMRSIGQMKNPNDIRQIAEFLVERQVRIIDGKPCGFNPYGFDRESSWLPLRGNDLYVHPEDGLLKRA